MTTEIENGQKVISEGEKCSKEIAEILKKYNCTLICQKQEMYGQIIYVPIVAEIKK
jgi:hypothetical protein